MSMHAAMSVRTRESAIGLVRTFIVCDDAVRDLDLPTRGKVARSGLEEEEGLLRDRVVELLGVLAVVAANSYNLGVRALWLERSGCGAPQTYLLALLDERRGCADGRLAEGSLRDDRCEREIRSLQAASCYMSKHDTAFSPPEGKA